MVELSEKFLCKSNVENLLYSRPINGKRLVLLTLCNSALLLTISGGIDDSPEELPVISAFCR